MPLYEAVSYVWGDTERFHRIKCNHSNTAVIEQGSKTLHYNVMNLREVSGYTIRVNGYFPSYRCSLPTFHHGYSINLIAANAETVEIGFCSILYLNVY
jgi:hypothetical protein